MITETKTKTQAVLDHLLTGRSLTQGEAIVLGYGTRLADKIFRLKKAGHRIIAARKFDLKGTPYAEYALARQRNRA